MPGYEALRRLTPEQHEAAVKLLSEAMASAAMEALLEPAALKESLQKIGSKPLTEAFVERASDFLDIRGDLTEFIRKEA